MGTATRPARAWAHAFTNSLSTERFMKAQFIILLAFMTRAAAAETNIVFSGSDGKYQFTMDTAVAPDLSDWANTELAAVVREWYPKIVKLLPSEGFEPTTNVTIRFRDNMRGTPASAGGGRVNCN